jgi:heme/copper-type cytochrome/quinol oxidase subunit 2
MPTALSLSLITAIFLVEGVIIFASFRTLAQTDRPGGIIGSLVAEIGWILTPLVLLIGLMFLTFQAT